MFYPENSLRKGGRFHLCWVADSWPACFASITQRQLWSQDIRKICDDLLEVMTNESGRPSHRFSLRLSSQLMRGLVRLYQKKVNSMLADLCMINARIMKNSNRKFNIHHAAEEVERQMVPLLELPALVREPVPEPEERVEEMIRQSCNVVPNIEAITLKEAAIPDFQLPPNDGFGEENPNQALQLLQDRTLEEMLGAPGPHSALDGSAPVPAPAQRAERSAHGAGLQLDKTMEPMSELDATLFRKSTAQDLLLEESDKEIPIPEIPPPDLPIPNEKEKPLPEPAPAPEEPAPAPAPAEVPAAEKPAPQEPEILTLETLEEGQPQAKRRRKNKLIIDKNHQLSKKFLRARIENIHVDLRCEEFSEDIADLRVPAELLLHRPAHAGGRLACRVARALARLYSRNLGRAAATHHDRRDMELALASRVRRATVQIPEAIPEEPPQIPEPQLQEPVLEPQVPESQPQEPALEPQVPEPQPQEPALEPQVPEPQAMEQAVLDQSAAVPDLSAVDVEKDIADLPTQKLATQKSSLDLSLEPKVPDPQQQEPAHEPQVPEPQPQEPALEPQIPEPQPMEQAVLDQSAAVPDLSAVDVGKDIADLPTQKGYLRESQNTVQKKKPRCGYTTFRESQSQNLARPEPEIVEKENIPDNWQTIPAPTEDQPIIPNIEIQRASDPERVLTSMLQEAGLADLQITQPEQAPVETEVEEPPRKSRRRGSGSGSSETMLGSLDRTKVSLGDSDQTTDSKRFIRDQWGTEGTMVKILKMVKAETRPLNMDSLMSFGPMVPGYKCIIAARCFTSILKLKQHGFIKVHKDPDTLEILDIYLGPKFNIC